ncbi:4-phosphoerythronate dehydrogenase [bacterium]|nr:4-phosphoerythronate dehydrogenase [bacterium]
MKFVADKEILYVKEAFSTLGEVELLTGNEINHESTFDCDGIIVRTITKITPTLLKKSRVSFIGTATSGTDHVDRNFLKKNQIEFASAPGCNAIAVAEFVIFALVAYSKKNDLSLKNQVLGIIGAGNAGTALRKRAEILGIKCLLNDPPLEKKTQESKFVSLQDLIEQSNIISLHVPLVKTGRFLTHHLISESVFRNLKNDAIIINTSRGGVIDEEALLKYRDVFQGLILDVWENEPNIDKRVLKVTDIATPHIAGYSKEGKIRATEIIYNAACRHFKVKPEWNSNQHKDFSKTPEIHVESTEDFPADVFKHVYDIALDDSSLRKIVTCSDPKKQFKELRNNYNFRNELSAFKLRIGSDLPAEVRSILLKLGCKPNDP